VFKASANELFKVETLRLTKLDVRAIRTEAVFLLSNIRELCLTVCKERVLDDCAHTFNTFKSVQTCNGGNNNNNNTLQSLIISTEVYENEDDDPNAYLGFKEKEAAASSNSQCIPLKQMFDQFERHRLREFRVNMCEVLSYAGPLNYGTFSGAAAHGWSMLEELYLSKCRIGRVEANSFVALPRLKELDLNSSHIEFLDRQAFNGLTSLTLLILWKNRLSRIEPGTFDPLSSLQELNLRSNRLEQLEPNLFARQTRLVELNLECNSISWLDEDVFAGLAGLQYLELIGNPLAEEISEQSTVFTKHLRSIKHINLVEDF
jgi:hypothetical protein